MTQFSWRVPGFAYFPFFAAVIGVLVASPVAGPAWAQGALEDDKAAEIVKELKAINNEMRVQRRQLILRLEKIEERLRRLEGTGGRADVGGPKLPKGGVVQPRRPSPRQLPDFSKKPGSQDGTAKATVCREGCRFESLKGAIMAARDGDTITVAPGLYGMCGIINKSLHLRGLRDSAGKRAHLGGGVCWGKGPLIATAPKILIEGFEISNVKVGSRNGACVRIDAKTQEITIRDIYCHDSENGILGNLKNGVITIENSRFERNGANNGQAHGIYISQAKSLVIRNTQVLSSKGAGHSVKSGARRTLVEDSVIAALEGHNSRAIDFFAGGELIVRRSVIQQAKNSDNHDAFGIAREPKRLNPEPHSTLLENNWIIFDDLKRCCRFLFTANKFGPFTVRGNKIVGMTKVNVPSIERQVAGNNKIFRNRAAAGLPRYDGLIGSLPKPGQ